MQTFCKRLQSSLCKIRLQELEARSGQDHLTPCSCTVIKLDIFWSLHPSASLLGQDHASSGPCRRRNVTVRAERSGGGGFLAGFVVGGTIFGALGFLFAPQISAALLSEDQRLKLPRFLEEEEKDPEATKQDLADKIAQLNSAIDDVSAQLKAQDNGTSSETAAAGTASVPA
ncbi:hypothetical protein WJX73_000738 [Symbiochloris irregularis]|uniref:Uncharacterized protein n=1 Tax=Symbiochloris irregularis TaxID=706552 RepID=A0AAW1P5K4_9CHLO